MNKIQPITCAATNDLNVTIPDPSGKNIVLYFYPKDSTPGCTIEGQDFRDHKEDFDNLNTLIYGVSRDSLKSHENFKSKQNFNFELISDHERLYADCLMWLNLKKCMARSIWEL